VLASTPALAATAPEKLAKHPRVQAAIQQIRSEDALTLREQIEIAEIPAPPFQETARAQDYLRRLEAAGLEDASIDSTGNVIGLRKGSRGTPLLVISAHLDTVFPEGTDVKVTQRDGRYFGRGLADDSRGLTALLSVLRAMEANKLRTVGNVMFVATVGEEGLGDLRGVKALFRDHANIDGFLSVDTTAGKEGHRIIAHATGSHRWEISFIGPGGHSFGAFGTPSAIHAMGRAIAQVGDVKTPSEPKTTFTVGVVSGGTSVNTIAADAKMLVDIRSNDGPALLATEKDIMAAIERGVAAENVRWNAAAEKRVRFEPKLLGDRPAGVSPAGSAVVRVSGEAWKALGFAIPELETASTDANVPIGLGIPAATVSGGGEGGGAHGPDEWYKPVEAWQGPQALLLSTLALVGLDGVTRPELPVRKTAR
jgi:acetylornithine deacetylase/succinyl-diaminopimelate desuccinylase-like protein